MTEKTIENRILMTGVTGSLGSQIAAKFIMQGAHVLAAARSHNKPADVQAVVEKELNSHHLARLEDAPGQLTVVPFKDVYKKPTSLGVDEVFHCAASLDYHNPKRLREANVELTRDLLAASQSAGAQRFIYLSTAFSSGCRKGLIHEKLHDESCMDLTQYTSTKREAEHLVADSGMPYLILRPSIVIGDSVTGRYPGRPHGLYQLWSTAERVFLRASLKVKWVIAPKLGVPLVHQDAFLAAVDAAYHHSDAGTIINITSNPNTVPTSRDLARLWLKPERIASKLQFFDKLDESAEKLMDKAHRLFYRRVATNIHFVCHPWRFETDGLQNLQNRGVLEFNDATFDSVKRCHDWFVERVVRAR